MREGEEGQEEGEEIREGEEGQEEGEEMREGEEGEGDEMRGRGGARGRGRNVRGRRGARGRQGGRGRFFVHSTIPWTHTDIRTDSPPTPFSFNETTGPHLHLPSDPQPDDFLSAFHDEDVLGHIMDETNRYIISESIGSNMNIAYVNGKYLDIKCIYKYAGFFS